eukprot:gene10815-11970_t
MPPKKKAGKGKKKKKDDKDELNIEEKYKKTLFEIESMKEHLAMRTDLARRAQSKSEEMKEKMLKAKDTIEAEKQNKLEISADLTRQYKTMQTELTLRVHNLEKHLAILQDQLTLTQRELKKTKEEKKQITEEKDLIIENLQFKIDNMESAYENILHDALDVMGDKIEAAKERWKVESTSIQENNRRLLLEFGLNPLDI